MVVKDSDGAVEKCRLFHFSPGDGEDITDEHVFQMLGFAGSLAHQKNRGGGSNSIRDADKGFLGDVPRRLRASAEDGGAEEREPQADPVGTSAVGVHAATMATVAPRAAIWQREIDEDDAAFHDVDAEIGMIPVRIRLATKAGRRIPASRFNLLRTSFQLLFVSSAGRSNQ